MQVPLMLEQISATCYRATGGVLLPYSIEAATREDAIRKYREAVAERLINGAELISVEVPETSVKEHPLAQFAGTLPDDALTAEWLREIEKIRYEDAYLEVQQKSANP